MFNRQTKTFSYNRTEPYDKQIRQFQQGSKHSSSMHWLKK